MTLLGFIAIVRESLWKFLPPYAMAGIRTNVSRTCTTLCWTSIQDRFTDWVTVTAKCQTYFILSVMTPDGQHESLKSTQPMEILFLWLQLINAKDKMSNVSNEKLLFPYIALISAFAAQMALLGFFYFFLSLSLPECVTFWSRIIPVHVREREVRRKKKKKKAQKKTFAVTGTWTHRLCFQSRASYPLGHGALPITCSLMR